MNVHQTVPIETHTPTSDFADFPVSSGATISDRGCKLQPSAVADLAGGGSVR